MIGTMEYTDGQRFIEMQLVVMLAEHRCRYDRKLIGDALFAVRQQAKELQKEAAMRDGDGATCACPPEEEK